jgi:hypothetical protein
MIRLSHLSAVVLAAALIGCTEELTTPVTSVSNQPSFALGNGYPEGGHDYKVNIIGVPKDKSATLDGSEGRRIFVQLYSDNVVTDPGGKNNDGLKKGGGDDQNHIYLCNSSADENDAQDARCDAWRTSHPGQFGVIDANATDGDGALFGLPDPCTDASSLTPCTPTYRVWARARTPQGDVRLTTCADETGTGFDGEDDVWCGSNGITLSKQTAFKAIDVTDNLLRMTITVDGVANPQLATCIGISTTTTTTLNVYLFDNCFENYFWNYDNNGLKNLELRFYFVS